MGWAKTDEDIREKIDNRMRDSGRSYYGNTYINRYPDYPSKKPDSTVVTYYLPQNNYHSTANAHRTSTSTYYPTHVSVPSVTATKAATPKTTPTKRKIGYIKRNYEHNGIEIYFYYRPDESLLYELKDEGWHWHRQKKCWFRKYSASNQRFAEKIIEQ